MLLLQRTHSGSYAAPTWRFTTICNSDLRESNIIFWHAQGIHTYSIQAKHSYISSARINVDTKQSGIMSHYIQVYIPRGGLARSHSSSNWGSEGQVVRGLLCCFPCIMAVLLNVLPQKVQGLPLLHILTSLCSLCGVFILDDCHYN